VFRHVIPGVSTQEGRCTTRLQLHMNGWNMGKCVKFVVFDLTYYCLFRIVSVVLIKSLTEDDAGVSKRVLWYLSMSYKYFWLLCGYWRAEKLECSTLWCNSGTIDPSWRWNIRFWDMLRADSVWNRKEKSKTMEGL